MPDLVIIALILTAIIGVQVWSIIEIIMLRKQFNALDNYIEVLHKIIFTGRENKGKKDLH